MKPSLSILYQASPSSGAVFKGDRGFVSRKPCSTKAAEAEVGQRPMPPRTTPAQLGLRLTRRAQAKHRFTLKTAPCVETAGSFDADAELKIWVSGGGLPIVKEFKKGTDVVGLQQYLAFCVFGGSIKG